MTKNDVIAGGVSLPSLREKRAALLNEVKYYDEAIRALENLEKFSSMNTVSSNQVVGIVNNNQQQSSIVFKEDVEASKAFSELTTIDAAVAVLKTRAPMTTQPIIDEIRKRGKTIEGKNPYTNVFSILSKNSKSNSPRVKKLADGFWDLVR